MDTKQLVLKYYVQKKGVIGIQGILSSKYKINITTDEIKGYIKELNEQGITSHNTTTKDLEKADGGLKEIVKSVEQDRKYDYNPDTGHVILYIDNIPHPLLVTTLDEIIASFSSKGKNWSSQKVKYEFGLTDQVWIKLKNLFKIYKDTVPFSIITMLEIPDDKYEDVAKEKAEQLVGARMNRIYDMSVESEYRRLVKKIALDNGREEMVKEYMNQALEMYNIKPIDVKGIIIPKIKNNTVLNVSMADMHLGKTGTDGIINRIHKLTADLINRPERIINITFLGDLGELFLPYAEMHVGQRLGMEDIQAPELIKLVVITLTEMLMSLYQSGKKITFYGMGGNHDRFSELKQYDPFNTPAIICYYWIEMLIADTDIDFNIWRQRDNSIDIGNIRYLNFHGDELTQKEVLQRAIEYIEPNMYLMVVSADKHHFDSLELTNRVLWTKTPALAGAGRYDKQKGLTSIPGVMYSWENEDGLIDFTIKRFK